MPSAWSDLDHPFPIERLQRTYPTKDQNTGRTVAGSINPTAITGDFQPSSQLDEVRAEGGLIEEGDAVLFTSEDMPVGELVRVHTDDGGTYDTWRVKGVDNDYAWFHDADGSTQTLAYVLQKWEET